MSILVVGTVALDSVETPSGKRDDGLGGSALFFSAAASHFSTVHLVGVVGKDFPMVSIDFLKKRNVNFDGMHILEGKTFRWGGKYHEDLNTRDTLFTELNVIENFYPTLPALYQQSEYVFLANTGPKLQEHILNQVKNPKLVICDTMNLWIEIAKEDLLRLLKRVDILLLNDSEAQQLSGQRNLVHAAKKIHAMGPHTVIIKKGEHGALILNKNLYFYSPAYPVEVAVDPTGAGDAFAGGFVGYLAKVGKHDDTTLKQAMIMGTVMGSYCVEKFSLDGLVDIGWEDILNRYNKIREFVHFEPVV